MLGVEGAHGHVGHHRAHELAPLDPGGVAVGGAAIDEGDIDVGVGIVGAAAERTGQEAYLHACLALDVALQTADETLLFEHSLVEPGSPALSDDETAGDTHGQHHRQP